VRSTLGTGKRLIRRQLYRPVRVTQLPLTRQRADRDEA
jgi:hypothetical protein